MVKPGTRDIKQGVKKDILDLSSLALWLENQTSRFEIFKNIFI